MSLLLITNPPTTFGSNADWVTLLTRSNGNMLGHGLSIPIFTLTNWDGTTTRPQIAEGSIIEVGGSFYQADADTAIIDEGGIGDGTVHIKLIPGAGSPDPLTVVPTLTNDALPAWDANKAGWYTAANKYLPYEMTKASAVYTIKSEYIDQNKTVKISSGGSIIVDNINVDSVTTNTVNSGAITATTLNTGQGANELYDMNQNVKSTNNVTFTQLALTGPFLPRITTTVGSWTVPGGGTQTIPRGVYTVYNEDNTDSIDLEVTFDSGWDRIEGIPLSTGTLVISDGVNYRLNNTNVGSVLVRYRRH